MKRVVIVGGGLTGLAIAHALERAEEPCSVHLLEASAQLGGNVRTVTHNAMILDVGADGWRASKPHVARLVDELGLADELIETEPDARRVHVARQRTLHPLPEDVLAGVPHGLGAFWKTALLDPDAKLRAALDFLVPARTFGEQDDESVYAFVARRLGAEVADRIAVPLVRGTRAGDAAMLSVRACAPELFAAERTRGSILRAMREEERPRRGDAFVSLKRGVGDLVVNVAHKLKRTEVETGQRAERIEPRGAGWLVHTPAGTREADAVALTTARVAPLVEDFDAELAAMCDELAYASIATVFLAYRKFDVRHPLDAYGVLLGPGSPVLAVHFVSSKWQHRAPSGQVLIRVDLADSGESDTSFVHLARARLLDLVGIERPPAFAKVFRLPNAALQPFVGHPTRMRRLAARVAAHDGLHFAAPGVGVADAVRAGFEIAARIAPVAQNSAGSV